MKIHLILENPDNPLYDDYNDYEPSFKARHQINQYGFGLDYKLNDGLHLYLRHFFYAFMIKISANKINVSETTVEKLIYEKNIIFLYA